MTGPGGEREAVLRRAVVELQEARGRAARLEAAAREPVAVVGMACRLPGGVDGPEDLWKLLCEGRDGVREVPPERWSLDEYHDPDPDAPGKTYTRHAGLIDDPLGFDARFFDISPREAGWMDPQHRIVLELGWTALEHAGIAPDRLRGSATGVFMGITSGDYAHVAMKHCTTEQIDAYTSGGNAANFAAGRLSYVLGLTGPSTTLDTACSSSLVAVHLACQSLRGGESDLALAGGVNLLLLPETTVALAKGRMLSVGGRCRTFDAGADGYVRGEGCGIVVLKRLSDAIAAGDRVWAVLRGSAVNQDGRSSGLTVPYAAAQEAVIARALEVAGVAPEEVGYVEAHGTGTPLGDPIELRALSRALGGGRRGDDALWVGSLKTNVGHLEAAAGVAALIKTVLVVSHGEIPEHLHLREPTPHVDWQHSGLRVPTALTSFPPGPRIAGVSSFGISGTNAHVVVGEAPAPAPSRSAAPGGEVLVVKLAARGDEALLTWAELLADFADAPGAAPPDELAWRAGIERADLPDRGAVIAGDRAQLVTRLRVLAAGGSSRDVLRGRVAPGGRPKVAFLVAGQGVRYGGSARELVDREPACARVIDALGEVLGPRDSLPLAALLEPGHDADRALARTEVAQPAIYALALALAAWWRAAGVAPDVVLGHSAGAYAAAVIAGALDAQEGARLVADRGRLMATLPPDGGMAAVFAGADAVAGYLDAHRAALDVAAFNAPQQTVLSGRHDVLETVLEDLRARAITCRSLPVSHAFHSPLVEPILAELGTRLRGVAFASPLHTLISDTTGAAIDDELGDPAYWTRHARQPVDFVAALRAVGGERCRQLVELGPGSTLLSHAHDSLAPHIALPSLDSKTPAPLRLRRSLAHAWTHGTPIDWHTINPQPGTRTPRALPTYRFQHARHTLPEVQPADRARAPADGGSPLVPRPIPSPIAQRLFEIEVSTTGLRLLAEHRLHDKIVVPGVVYLELLLESAALAGLAEPAIDDLVLPAPLVLVHPDARLMQISLQPIRGGSTTAQIHSYDPGAPQPWSLHAHATISAGGAGATAPVRDLRVLGERLGPAISGADFYADVWHPSFELGPQFRLVEQVARGDHEALAALTLPEPGGEVRAELLLLDACVQVLMAALPPRPATSPRPLTVGTGHRGFVRHRRRLPQRVWCHAVVSESDRGAISGDLEVFDEDGAPLASIAGVGFAPLAAETLDRLGHGGTTMNGGPPDRPLVELEPLIAAEPKERARMVSEHLRAELGAVLGLPASEIDLDEPLVALADSLMLAELKARIEGALAVPVAIEVLFEQPSLRELAGWLASQLGGAAEGEDLVADDDELLARLIELEQLSDEDALALADEAGRPRRTADG